MNLYVLDWVSLRTQRDRVCVSADRPTSRNYEECQLLALHGAPEA